MSNAGAKNDDKYCILPWTHLSNTPLGEVRPCCIYTESIKEHGQLVNVRERSFNQILRSDYMKNVRDQFRNGVFPEGCRVCRSEEENGRISKRQQALQWADYRKIPIPDYRSEPESVKDLQVIFSNHCNLKCRTCNPNYSTKWIQEAKDRNLTYYGNPESFSLNHPGSKLAETLDDWTRELVHIEYMGGEPFLQVEFKSLTDYLIKSGRAKDVTLSLSTNASLDSLSHLQSLTENFRAVGVNLSIDGLGMQYEYMRHPAKWDETLANIEKIYSFASGLKHHHRKLVMSVGHTVSWLNVYYVPEFFNFFKKHFEEIECVLNLVWGPRELSVSILPAELKSEIKDKFAKSGYESLVSQVCLPGGDEYIFLSGIKNVIQGDQYRNESYQASFPEMYALIEPYWVKAADLMQQNEIQLSTET